MERKNRLAVFEHVPHKERTSPLKGSTKYIKRGRSPEPSYNDSLNERPVKRRRRIIQIKQEHISITCAYENCEFTTENYYEFLKHVDEHAVINLIDDDDGCYECLWDDCAFETENLNTFKQHLSYHAFHLKLQIMGGNMLKKTKLPDCKEPYNFQVPNQPEKYLCEWDHCGTAFLCYQVFVDHVKCHVNTTPKNCFDVKDVIRCEWTGCSTTCMTQYKLLEHSRCHTKEKTVACPTCGVMFSCKTKFHDHRKRQLSVDLQGYQCSQCSKSFASERLLRDHMRIHINHYKCHLCDMTCPKPSSLAKHIRYRHLLERLFKCDICNHATKTQLDLLNHRETHSYDCKMECLMCDYKCRSKFGIEKHVKVAHEGGWEFKYACHCCEKKFARGALLTKHLINVHDFHWPSGHSRFSYKQDAKTGLFHLQVVRYESLEVTQEMMQGNISSQLQNGQDFKFKCEQTDAKQPSFIFKLVEEQDDPSSSDETVSNDCKPQKNEPDVLITIEEIDSEGKIIKFERSHRTKILCESELVKNSYKLIK